MTVWRSSEQKAHAARMALCSPETAFEWLRSQAPSTTAEVQAGLWSDPVFLLSDYVLCRRSDPQIDLALARWSRVPTVVRRVFNRGGSAVRLAAWSNPTEKFMTATGFWADKPELSALVAHGTLSELRAFAANPSLSDQVLESLFKRKGAFEGIADQRWRNLLLGMATNTRLSQPYPGHGGDGLAEYHHDQVFEFAWSIANEVPATQEWASVVWQVLRHCRLPHGLRDTAMSMVERWHVDPPRRPGRGHYSSGPGFFLRSRLADLLQATDDMRDNDDLAIRMSYFRRFDPKKDAGWPQSIRAEFATDTPEGCIEAALENPALWTDEADRNHLRDLCRECPDPRDYCMMPDAYMRTLRRMKKERTGLIPEQDYEDHEEVPPSLDSKMDALAAQVAALSIKATIKKPVSGSLVASVPWWGWLIAGLSVGRLLAGH